jgi:hypothetical protein
MRHSELDKAKVAASAQSWVRVGFWLRIGVTSGAKSKFGLVSISCRVFIPGITFMHVIWRHAQRKFQFCKGFENDAHGKNGST